MPVVSKLPCYYIAHPWTPSCSDQVFMIAKSGYWAALKIYLAFYLAASLLKRNRLKYFKEQFVIDVLRSTNFLAINAWAFTGSFCLWRYLLGRLYTVSIGFLPGLTASLFAISCENSHRRRVLAVYMTTTALDCVYRMLRSRGHVPSVPYADLILFGIASSLLVRLLKLSTNNAKKSDVLRAIQFLVGPDESRQVTSTEDSRPQVKLQPHFLDLLDDLAVWRFFPDKSPLCAHNESTCVWYATKGGLRLALYGACLQAALNAVSAARGRKAGGGGGGGGGGGWRSVLGTVVRDVSGLASFGAVYGTAVRCTCCVLRRSRGKDEAWHGAVGGAIGALGMKFYRSTEVAVFVLSRVGDFYYEEGIRAGVLPKIRYGTALLYAFSTAVMFHAAAFEPHNIKPSYWFSVPVALSGGLFKDLNRRLLSELNSQSCLYRPDYWPNYDPQHVPDYMLTDGALQVLGIQS